MYIGPFGEGMPRINSIECLNWKFRGTPIGEVNMSLYSSMTLSTYFYCVVRAHGEVTNVVGTFFTLRVNDENDQFLSLCDDLPTVFG